MLRRVVIARIQNLPGVAADYSSSGLKSAVTVPIFLHGQVVATLGLYRTEPVGFDMGPLEFISSTASLYAPALDDIRSNRLATLARWCKRRALTTNRSRLCASAGTWAS